MIHFLVALLLACTASLGQTAPDARWKSLQFLLGSWTTLGLPADVTGGFSFQPDLAGHAVVRRSFVQMVNGPRHEELLVIYLDGPEMRAICFDSEGKVTQYKVTLPTPNRVVFETEFAPEEPWSYRSDGKNLKGSVGPVGNTLEWTAIPETK
jgi:hypothetical protein